MVQSDPGGCATCAFWRAMGSSSGTCRRYAPDAGHGAADVAHWPETHRTDSCGDWHAAGSDPGQRLISCVACRHWHRPASGLGLAPMDRRDQPYDWWRHAGLCTRHAPRPLTAPGYRGFWRATHCTDGCAEAEAGAQATTAPPPAPAS